MTVWLAKSALRAMYEESSSLYPLESGGILLGWRDGGDRIVVNALGPGPQALHGRHRFLPDHAWQVFHIRQIFEESIGDIDYLGDWHSHPDGGAAMSAEDQSTLKRISRRVRKPLMLILSGVSNNESWTFDCWKGNLHRGFILRRFEVFAQEVKLFDPPSNWPTVTSDLISADSSINEIA